MAKPPAMSPPTAGLDERDALLATKLHIPRPRPGFVLRLRLLERLDEGMEQQVVLVCTPAGFGKTSLLADWARRRRRPVAWLSLDEADNDPTRFWRHVVAALDCVRPGAPDRVAKDGRPLGDSVWRLAEQARTRLIPNAEQRLAALTNTSDQVRVHRARQEFETSLQVGRDPDYRYPSRYLGTQAADQPIPPEPWARPHDPEEVPTLSDRTVRDLDAENSHSGFVRIRAITHRTRLALVRGDRNRPARQPGDAPPLRARRGRGDRPEPDRER